MRATLSELQQSNNPDMQAVAKRFDSAIGAADQSLQWMLGQNDPTLPSASSVEYLMMLGRLSGGWMSARTALVALKMKSDDGADHEYLDARVALARYYADRFLPLVDASNITITEGSESTVSLSVAQL